MIKNKLLDPTVTTFAQFMKDDPSLITIIDDLFKGEDPDNIKSHLFSKLYDMNSIQKEKIVEHVLHENGKPFDPSMLMCLFVCGMIKFPIMNFQRWNSSTNNSENDYIREFLSFIAYPRKILIFSESTQTVVILDEDMTHTIPDKLFVSSSIPDTAKNVVIMDSFPEADPWKNLSLSLHYKDIITSDPVLWYAYVIQGFNKAEAWADTERKPVKCIGVVDRTKDRSYLFTYNFQKYEDELDQTTLWSRYINEPYSRYTSYLGNFTLRDDTTWISKVTLEKPWLLYVHLLIMTAFGTNRKFYACTDSKLDYETIQNALVPGKTYAAYRDLLSHAEGSPNPLTIETGVQDENVMERLAIAHLELMQENPSFRYLTDPIDNEFNDMLNSTCPVKYDWVFENANLTKSVDWLIKIKTEMTAIEKDVKTTVDPRLGVIRHISYFMLKAKSWDDTDAFFRFAQKFTKTVNVGAKVDNDSNQRIVLDLQKHGDTKKIFKRDSKFKKKLSETEDYTKAMEEYFQGV